MATDYAFVVTWTYFSFYVFIFLIVSIVCAFTVRSEYTEFKNKDGNNVKWSIAKLFRIWAKLLWRKKKVYGQLIPHFFDQATDLGVIFEYYKLRNENDIGIDTMYLFVISICVLIFHRIISSAAIYHLTKKPIYMLYQIFDLLMIRCIWTNYKLDSDEPSNSQRYLQILEATFESAPQILISTAFLVKASTSSANNPIVIISLITSVWSLSARVSADDKLMFKDEWKSLGCNSRFPFVNYRYIIRVFLWRFLEISSRIILLCLMWINLGGLSVFIVLGVEFIYLSVICFGLQSVSIMGNIIYLVAANSSKKSEAWTMLMTRIFWSYRVVSSYLYLILVTVFATTRFDAPKINDYQTRYAQTIEETVGFAIFLYCWIVTPIWQWIGAVIVFDYGNISSVGRDVYQLMNDGKYLDVLELISFGANFNAQATLQQVFSKQPMFAIAIADICLVQLKQKKKVQDAVFNAAYDGNDTMIEYLLDKTDVTANILDDRNRTPLFYAAAQNHPDLVATLIGYGASCTINIDEKEQDLASEQSMNILQYKEHLEIIKIISEMIVAKEKENSITAIATRKQVFLQLLLQQGKIKIVSQTLDTAKWIKDRNQYDKPILNFSRYLCVGLLFLVCLAAVFGPDIAGLVINSKNDCNEALIKGSAFVSFDVNDFILGGCITHLVIFVFIFFNGIFIFESADSVQSGDETYLVSAAFCCPLIFVCWLLSWSVIGFLMYSEMDKSISSNKQCADAILSWSIISCIHLLASPFGAVGYIKMMCDQ